MSANQFLSGERLVGEDFSEDQLDAWFQDEKEGFCNLPYEDAQSDSYFFSALNWHHGFRYIPDGPRFNVLSIGGSYGAELDLVRERLATLTVIEPGAGRFQAGSRKIEYVEALASGRLLVPDSAFNLCICFGSLHHIANVSSVLREISRALRFGGYLLLREPVISMGDWTKPRPGLTSRERGIPLALLDQFLTSAGFEVVHQSPCMFSPLDKGARILGFGTYNSPVLVRIDAFLSGAFAWNRKYHRTRWWHKFGPASTFVVAKKCLNQP